MGEMPFSRSSRVTVRPVGPWPITIARPPGSSDEDAPTSDGFGGLRPKQPHLAEPPRQRLDGLKRERVERDGDDRRRHDHVERLGREPRRASGRW